MYCAMKIEERKTMKKINFVPANLSISENSSKCSGQKYLKRGFSIPSQTLRGPRRNGPTDKEMGKPSQN